MGSQGGGSGGDAMEEPRLQPLSRQGSLMYSLTLDEVQNHLGGGLGKPLGSMNLDELLRNVWSVEGNNDNSNGPPNLDTSSLNMQPSFALSRDLSKKTVEEVWKDIQQGKKKGDSLGCTRDAERRPTLGEMTLEDFLVKAGVVGDVVGAGAGAASTQPQWGNYQQQKEGMTVFMGGGQQAVVPLVMDIGYPDSQLTVSPSSLMGTLSDTAGRKRGAHGVVVEKTVERRQKRMIKNRESAARSRARKQAYTHELENKVSRLEEENARLRRQKEVEKVLPSAAPPSEPKNQLRRTSSAPF